MISTDQIFNCQRHNHVKEKKKKTQTQKKPQKGLTVLLQNLHTTVLILTLSFYAPTGAGKKKKKIP